MNIPYGEPGVAGRLDGHLWTIAPWLRYTVRPAAPPPSDPWTTLVSDPLLGEVRLHGRLSRRAGARALVVIVHGLGGTSAGYYAIAAARAAERAGLASLRLDLRGAPGDGEDLYNAGLTADLRAAVASEALAEYTSIYVLGYSLGGHLALRYATEQVDPRVRAVAAVCPPLDLDRSAEAIDAPARWLYRRHLLVSLKAMFAALLRRRPALALPSLALPSLAEVRAVSRLRAWDDLVVATRFGFRSAEHYYAESSVAPRLPLLVRPALLVASAGDPMIPAETLLPALEREHPLLDVRWRSDGGHVAFPASLDLGLGGEPGLEPQILRWMRKVGAG